MLGGIGGIPWGEAPRDHEGSPGIALGNTLGTPGYPDQTIPSASHMLGVWTLFDRTFVSAFFAQCRENLHL